jgi:glutathione peroxidase-family protein
LVAAVAAMAMAVTMSAQSIYDIKVKDMDGKEVSMSEYKGKVLLIVNTATKCGFTPQYEELQELYDKFKDKKYKVKERINVQTNVFDDAGNRTDKTTTTPYPVLVYA